MIELLIGIVIGFGLGLMSIGAYLMFNADDLKFENEMKEHIKSELRKGFK